MINIKQVQASEVYGLRHSILRPTQDISVVYLNDDNATQTKHFAAYADEHMVGCISVFFCNNPLFARQKQAQLRFLAVEAQMRNLQIGKALVKTAEYALKNAGVDFVWLNSRDYAVGFYQKLGYQTAGEFFDIPTVCPHIAMYKYLSSQKCPCCENNV